MNKHISQRQAMKWRKQVADLTAEVRALRTQGDSVVERITLNRFSDTGVRVADAIRAGNLLGFRVEAVMEGNILCLSAVRRK